MVHSYFNPIVKCFECGEKFCFDHINGGMYEKSMKKNEDLRDVCEKCTDEHGYHSL